MLPDTILVGDLQVNPELRDSHAYLDVIDERSARPTGMAVRWDVAHSIGHWHASVVVLAVDAEGKVALQQRGEKDSHGKWDVSVAGHQDAGETDVTAGVREAEEELGLKINPARLIRLGSPYRFRKIGNPSIQFDHHESPTSYLYRTAKQNRERVSVFVVVLSACETACIRTGPSLASLAVKWVSVAEATADAIHDAARHASSFRQLFAHPEVAAELQKCVAGAIEASYGPNIRTP